MSIKLSTQDKEIKTKELFLELFQEKGVSIEELKEAICESYRDEGLNCNNFDVIPLDEMQTAILDCYEAGGLSFKNMDEVFAHDFNEED